MFESTVQSCDSVTLIRNVSFGSTRIIRKEIAESNAWVILRWLNAVAYNFQCQVNILRTKLSNYNIYTHNRNKFIPIRNCQNAFHFGRSKRHQSVWIRKNWLSRQSLQSHPSLGQFRCMRLLANLYVIHIRCAFVTRRLWSGQHVRQIKTSARISCWKVSISTDFIIIFARWK